MDENIENIANEIAQEIKGRIIRTPDALMGRIWTVSPGSVTVFGKYRERASYVTITPWGEHEIRCDCDIDVQFTIRNRSWWHIFDFPTRKRVKINDSRVDTLFEIHCNEDDFIIAWLSEEHAREMLIQASPFSVLSFNGSVLGCEIDMSTARIKAVDFINKVRVLDEMAQSLEKVRRRGRGTDIMEIPGRGRH